MERMHIWGTTPKGIRDKTLPGMLEYYRRDGLQPDDLESSAGKVFDPVAHKYDLKRITEGILTDAPGLDPEDEKCQDYWKGYHIQVGELAALDTGEKQRAFIFQRVYEYLHNYEDSHELASLTKKNFTHVMENLYMIYNTDDEEIRRVVQIIDLVSQNVISKYIQIDGLERLFNEQYIDFEWEMHLGMDHKQQTMKFYRDHFVHQVRDAYMMDRLLRDGGFYERVLDTLRRPNASKVSRYFCKMVKRQRDVPLPNGALLQYDEDFVPRNIIYMSAYMAGLFHDIGYPDTYLQSLRRRISAFAPGINSGNPMRDTLPEDTFSLLQNSLLFRLVPFEEIQTRVYQTAIDHGTLSAIAFLLHFYKNGVIFQLPPYQAAAVELAGLAIYNHTYVYGISGTGKKAPNDYRPRFLTNPISYLLRLCDDLQEWDRVYFEISSNSNLIICNRCRTPIVGQHYIERGSRIHRYVCNCYSDGQNGAFSRAFDGDLAFPYRRLYNIEVCNALQVEDVRGESLDNTKDICFRLRYAPYKLLHIAFISPSYARYRITELNNLKPLMLNQAGLPHMWLEYVVTANPIFLKTYLLEEYFKTLPNARQIENQVWKLADKENVHSLELAVNRLMRPLQPILNSLMDGTPLKTKEKECVKRKIKRALRLYCMLYLYGRMFRHDSDRPSASFQWIADAICRQYCVPGVDEPFQCLLGDCLLQLSQLYTGEQLSRLDHIPKAYMQQFAPGNWKKVLYGRSAEHCSKEFYDYALEQYVNPQEYRPACWDIAEKSESVDAFTDLGFFQALYKHLQL